MDDAQAVIFDRDGVLTQFNPASALQHINRVLPVSLEALLQHWQAYGGRVGFPQRRQRRRASFAVYGTSWPRSTALPTMRWPGC
ncbi:MAG: hypothetical protein R2854_21425 [Caldilineaceae bacterium]